MLRTNNNNQIELELDLDHPLNYDVFSMLRTVKLRAAQERKGLRLVGTRHAQAAAYDRAPLINDAMVKALMDRYGINEYVEVDEYSGAVKQAYTLADIRKTTSDFGMRNLGKFIAGLAIPSLFGGGVAAGLLGAGFLASFVASPVGPLAYLAVVGIGVGAFLAVSAIIAGVTYLVQGAKENKQLVQERSEIDAQKPMIEEAKKQAAVENDKQLLTYVARITIEEKFKELAGEVNKYGEFSTEIKKNLQDVADNKKSALLRKVESVVQKGSYDSICKLVDKEYKQAFAEQVAIIIDGALYKEEGINFIISLEDQNNPFVKAIHEKALNDLNEKKQARLNQFAGDFQCGRINDLAARLQEELDSANNFVEKAMDELRKELEPERLEARAAKQAKKDLAAAEKNTKDCLQILGELAQSQGSRRSAQSSSSFFKGTTMPVFEPVIKADNSEAKGPGVTANS